jgi:hypothetical protein
MLDAWRYRNRDSGSWLTYGSLGFLAGVVAALGIGGCSSPNPGVAVPVPTGYAVECQST